MAEDLVRDAQVREEALDVRGDARRPALERRQLPAKLDDMLGTIFVDEFEARGAALVAAVAAAIALQRDPRHDP